MFNNLIKKYTIIGIGEFSHGILESWKFRFDFLKYVLKNKLKNKYCIILSTAYSGENRFNGYCFGKKCEKRTFQLKYFYKKFKYNKNKKYIVKNKNIQLLEKYNEPLLSYSNSYYIDNKYGYSYNIKEYYFDYILFWNKVTKLK